MLRISVRALWAPFSMYWGFIQRETSNERKPYFIVQKCSPTIEASSTKKLPKHVQQVARCPCSTLNPRSCS